MMFTLNAERLKSQVSFLRLGMTMSERRKPETGPGSSKGPAQPPPRTRNSAWGTQALEPTPVDSRCDGHEGNNYFLEDGDTKENTDVVHSASGLVRATGRVKTLLGVSSGPEGHPHLYVKSITFRTSDS